MTLRVSNMIGFNAVAIEADARRFITAAGITNSAQTVALNKLVKDLKHYGLWTKLQAIYPFVGGTSTTHKFNLKDPRDLDAAFRLSFQGSWTHDANGVTPGGTTSDYADTFFNPITQSSSTSSFHLSLYKGAAPASGTSRIYMGAWDSAEGIPGGNVTYLGLVTAGALERGAIATPKTVNSPTAGTASAGTAGMTCVSCSGSRVQDFYLNGAATGTAVTATGVFLSTPLYIGAASDIGLPAAFPFNQSTRFATIGTGLDATEAANLFTAVEAFQDALSRGVV